MSNLVGNVVLQPFQIFDCAGNGIDIIKSDLEFGPQKEDSEIKSSTRKNESVKKATYQLSVFDVSSKTMIYEIIK